MNEILKLLLGGEFRASFFKSLISDLWVGFFRLNLDILILTTRRLTHPDQFVLRISLYARTHRKLGETFSKTVGMGERHIRKWVKRFIEQSIEGLYDGKRLSIVRG